MNWWRKVFINGPYNYVRSPVPQPGAENVTFISLGLPEVSPIAGAMPNLRTFQFQGPLDYADLMVGLQGYGGIPNQRDWGVIPLSNTVPEMPIQNVYPG